jgi:hypothetical protein
MKRLPPSGYVPAEETKKPGYLKARMTMYRKQIEEDKKKADAIKAEADLKVTKLGRRDPK